jgi:hypothetical protein
MMLARKEPLIVGSKREAKRKLAWEDEYLRCLGTVGLAAENARAVPKRDRAVAAIGLFYYQMYRNGSQLWLHNGYVDTWTKELCARLKELGTPAALEIRALAAELPKIKRVAYAREDEIQSSGGEGEGDPVLAECAERCNQIDRRFAVLSVRLARDLDDYWLASSVTALETPHPSRARVMPA